MMDNQNNQWQDFLETGTDVTKAVNRKQIIDVDKDLRAKYPNIPIPSADRIVRTISVKQQRGINYQQGEKQ